jgi:hypothetical protein
MSSNATSFCTYTHDQNGLNYVWLHEHYGKVRQVKFQEPADTGKWRVYTKHWWKIHCDVISHDEKDLVKAHVKAFVNKKTRFAKLMFYFQRPDGSRYHREPNKHFYELERDFFRAIQSKLRNRP